MKRRIHLLFVALPCLGVGLVLVGSFLGGVQPLGDSLAVIRIPVAVLGLLPLIRPRKWRTWIWVPMLSVLVLCWHGVDRLRSTAPNGPYSLYQKNVLFSNRNTGLLAQDILQANADFVTLQEFSPRRHKLLDELRPSHPHLLVCNNDNPAGPALASRYPFVPGTQKCSQWRAFAVVQVATPDGPIWLVSLHLFWPFPKWQSQQLDRILPKLAALDGPVILGGDFNMQPGTRVERVVRDATRTTALRPAFTTYHIGPNGVPVSIDQVLARCGTVERRPKLGSDHHGLLAHVGFSEETCRE